jgi:hypothetical protein
METEGILRNVEDGVGDWGGSGSWGVGLEKSVQ